MNKAYFALLEHYEVISYKAKNVRFIQQIPG